MGSVIAGAVILLVLLLLFALTCPVYYECSLGQGENYGRLRFAGGLFQKTFRLDENRLREAGEKGKEKEPPPEKPGQEEESAGPVPPERPIRLSPEGNRRSEEMEALPDEKESPQAEAPSEDKEIPQGELPDEKKPKGAEPPEETEGESPRPGWPAVLSFAWDNGTISLLLAALGRILRHSRPCEMRLTGEAGFADPMKTGLMAGAFAAALPGICRVQWQYVHPCLSLQWTMKGFVVPAYLIYTALRFLAAAPVRQTIAYRRGDITEG